MTKRSQRLFKIAQERMKLQVSPEPELKKSFGRSFLERVPILREGKNYLSFSDLRYFVQKQKDGTLEWIERWVLYCFVVGNPVTHCSWRDVLKEMECPFAYDPLIQEGIEIIWRKGKNPMSFDRIKELTLKQIDHSITEPEHFLLFAGLWKNDDGSNLWKQLHVEQDSWLFEGAAWGEAFNLYKEARQLPSNHKTLPGLNRHFKPPLLNG